MTRKFKTGGFVTKDTNPKDRVGTRKVPMSVIPAQVVLEVALGMYEGARKYGRSNYRVSGVRASAYYDATFRHLMAWWEGEDIDEESQISHVTKAISSLMVLRDAMLNDVVTDDRPPKVKTDQFIKELNTKTSQLVDKYPEGVKDFINEDK